MGNKIKLNENTEYVLKNGDTVTMVKNSLPYYCFSADVPDGHYLKSERWTSEGIAYHDDCGFNVLSKAGPDWMAQAQSRAESGEW